MGTLACKRLKWSGVDKACTYEVELVDQGKVCSPIPKIENLECIRKLKKMKIYENNIFERELSVAFEQNPQEIHLLLGADVVRTISMDVVKPLPWKAVVALKTKKG